MAMRTGWDGCRRLAACLAAALLVAACGEPSPEAQLEKAREALERARQEVASAEARYEEAQRKLEKARASRDEASEALEEARTELADARAEVGRFATDDAIFRSVQKKLLDDEKLDAVAIPVRVEDGVVVLTGEVPDASLAERAEELAAEVAGVIEVRNAIAVRASSGGAAKKGEKGGSSGASGQEKEGASGEEGGAGDGGTEAPAQEG